MSLSNRTPLRNQTFRTLTYSRLATQEPSETKTLNTYDLQAFHQPRLKKPAGGSKNNSKESSPANFKNATFPLATATDSAPTASNDMASLTAIELAKLSHQRTEDERDEILIEAREKAAEIMAAAEAEAEKIKTEVEKKAHAEGLKAAEKEIEKRIARFDELLEKLSTTQAYCRQTHESEMVQLALSCARKLVNRELKCDATTITDCVREVFNESSVQGNITLLLNNEDLQLINEQRSQLHIEFPQINSLKIEVGEGLERGGCILESAMGRIDASLHSKFEELQRLLNVTSGN